MSITYISKTSRRFHWHSYSIIISMDRLLNHCDFSDFAFPVDCSHFLHPECESAVCFFIAHHFYPSRFISVFMPVHMHTHTHGQAKDVGSISHDWRLFIHSMLSFHHYYHRVQICIFLLYNNCSNSLYSPIIIVCL